MFFPFTNYKKVTWSSETGGAAQLKYTASAKSMIVLEIPSNGVSYSEFSNVQCWYNNAGSSAVYLYNRIGTGAGNAPLHTAIIGSAIISAGTKVLWLADNSSGAENITLHIFELP